MSVKELEKQVKSLTPRQLANFSQWLNGYRETLSFPAVKTDDLSTEQKNEILRRREAFLADPSIAEPWEGTTERILKHLHARRAQKTAARRR